MINNIKRNVEESEKQKNAIQQRKDVMNEIKKMKEDFSIEWCQDLFWKCWKIKEGVARWDYLVKTKGETLAKKRIDSIKSIGGLEFIEVLQKEVYE